MYKVDLEELKRKIKVIKKQRRHTKKKFKKFTIWRFYVIISISVRRICTLYIHVTKTTFEKKWKERKIFFNVKDFLFYKYICEMRILSDIKKKVESHDLYRNKFDFWKNFEQKILILKFKRFYIS